MALPYEFITITPTKQTPSPVAKRRITPSPELTSPKKRLILSPTGRDLARDIAAPWVIRKGTSIRNSSSQLTNVFLEERKDFGLSHSHPDPPRPLPTIDCERIDLPFDLKIQPDAFQDKDNRELLWKIFPDIRELSFDRFLVLRLGELPPKPWPRVVAGVPCYLTKAEDMGPLVRVMGLGGNIKIRVAPETDGRDLGQDWDKVFLIAKDFFNKAQISVTEIQYWGNFLVVILEDEQTDLTKLARVIARCNCFYHFKKDFHRPQQYPALRFIEPSGYQADNSQYQVLRPGVMLGSERSPRDGVEMLTSSGVLIQHDHTRVKYLTVASHGFPSGGKVYHPSANGREIGELILELSHTNISLVKLHNNVQYVNETFKTSTMPDSPVRFKGFPKANETRSGDFVYMESPFNGFLEGTYGVPVFLRLPPDDPAEPEQQWVRSRWDYVGQDFGGEIKEGVCGSAIWNADMKVVGFFRYICNEGPMKDWAFSVAADHLIEKGYSLVVEPRALAMDDG